MRLLILALLISFGPHTQAAVSACNSLDACLLDLHRMAQARQTPHDVSTIQQYEQLRERMLKLVGAVPALVSLLADPDLELAELAASVLRDAESVDPKFLPQVIAGLDRGLGWLPPVLGAMQSDAACREAVARYLVSKSAPGNQEAYAVKRCGARAIPFLVEAADCHAACRPKDHELLGHALGEMGHERAQAGPALLRLASEEATSSEVAAGALAMIAALGADGRALEDPLIALRQHKLELRVAIDDALIGIGAKASGAIYAARLGQNPDVDTLRYLAETGAPAGSAGPAVVDLLKHPDWDVRVAAARALGFIGYAPASTALIPLLNEVKDVRLNWVAAESLGRLHAPDALRALRKTAASHWYPAVRQAAASAVQHIQDGSEYPSEPEELQLLSEFFAYEQGYQLAACKAPEIAGITERASQKLYKETAATRLEALAYDIDSLSFDMVDYSADGQPRVIQVTRQKVVRDQQRPKQIPAVALRFEGGWLAGSNRGEWGGELVYVADNGAVTGVLAENIEDLYRLGERVVVVVGIAHMFTNKGMLLELSRNADQSWSAKPWRALPGAPESSWLVQTGELQINTADGGSILVSADGTMRMAPCAIAN